MADLALDPERDPWDRQPKERAEHYDWFAHWRNDGERRTYSRVAQRFGVPVHKVRTVAHRNLWTPRLDAWRAAHSAQVRARFEELTESILVPWMQAAARMVSIAATAPADDVPPDRALAAATNVLRLAKEPTVSDLVRIAEAGAAERPAPASDDRSVTATIMAALEDHPEAREAAIEAVRRVSRRELA